jgi:CRISPR/Cas system CSM-associated protein Csm3 (group 7 of RAMP superfamily)
LRKLELAMLMQLEYSISFEALFHMGTGMREGLIDRTVARDANGLLYVPGSTVKGVLREHCEHLCHFYQVDGPNQPLANPHNARAVLRELTGIPPLISRVFGSQLSPGSLFFSDARQIKETSRDYQSVQTTTLTQVRLDRVTRSKVDEALFTSMFGIPTLTFTGTIVGQLDPEELADLTDIVEDEEDIFELTPTWGLLLLLAGLPLIERLGGSKSSGKGACRCELNGLSLDQHICPERIWQGWLEQVDMLGKYASSRNQKGGQT